MGPVRFDITYARKTDINGHVVAVRLDPNEHFANRAFDPIFVFPDVRPGEYIRFRLASPEDRIGLNNLTGIAGRNSPAAGDDLRVDHEGFAQLNLRRRLGLSIGTNDVFSVFKMKIVDSGPDSPPIGTHIPLAEGGGPGGDDWVVEC